MENEIDCNIVAIHVMNCKECQKVILQFFAQRAGSTVTPKKIEASKLNGLKGGRPKKHENKNDGSKVS